MGRDPQVRALRRVAANAPLDLRRELCECVLLGRPVRVAVPFRDLGRLDAAVAALGLTHHVGRSSFRLRVDRGMEHWSSAASACSDGQRGAVRFVYLHENADLCRALMSADEADDHQVLGMLLQYPPCCVSAFVEWRRHSRENDPIAMTLGTIGSVAAVCEYHGPSPFSRYLGGGLISHYSCGPDCRETTRAAVESLTALGAVFPSSRARLLEMESSLILFQLAGGACGWRRFSRQDGVISVDASSLVGDGPLCDCMRRVTSIRIDGARLRCLARDNTSTVLDRRRSVLSRGTLAFN